MLSKQATDWYEHQKRFDIQTREASDSILGSERDVFIESMAYIATCLDTVRESGPPQDLASKRKVGYATNAFNLLLSAWDAALVGRYSAAAGHWRSVNETSDVLLALQIEPAFAEQMQGRKSDMSRARKIVRKGFKELLGVEASAWLTSKETNAKTIQPYSHVSFEATGMSLGVGLLQDGKKVGVLRPGGAPAWHTLRLTARSLALDALTLACSVIFVFTDVGALRDVWEARFKPFSQEALHRLADESTQIGPLPGPLELILLLKSMEEPPNAVASPEANQWS